MSQYRTIVPADNHYVLEPHDLNEVDPSIKPFGAGIVIPASANSQQEALKAGKIVARPYSVAGQAVVPYQQEDIVLYPKGSGYEVKLDGKKYVVIAYNQIVGSIDVKQEEEIEK